MHTIIYDKVRNIHAFYDAFVCACRHPPSPSQIPIVSLMHITYPKGSWRVLSKVIESVCFDVCFFILFQEAT